MINIPNAIMRDIASYVVIDTTQVSTSESSFLWGFLGFGLEPIVFRRSVR